MMERLRQLRQRWWDWRCGLLGCALLMMAKSGPCSDFKEVWGIGKPRWQGKHHHAVAVDPAMLVVLALALAAAYLMARRRGWR